MTHPPNSPADVLSALSRNRKPRPSMNVHYAEPVGSAEALLAEIWSEVLRIDGIGRDDSLFSLGGNSLSVVRIMSRIYQRAGVEISLSECFENPTIAALADLLEERAAPSSKEDCALE